MGITTEVTVKVSNQWLSKEVLNLDINDVYQEQGFMSYSDTPSINEVFYEEVILETGQVQQLDLINLGQLILSEIVTKSFSYIHTLTIKNTHDIGILQVDVTGAGYAGAFLGNPTDLIPIGPSGALHFSTISGINTTDGQIDIRNTGTGPVAYQLFLAGNI